MTSNPFEYEERYKVTNPDKTIQALEAKGYRLTGSETQTDHWYIPNHIMSPAEQGQWFDHDMGYALRIREQTKNEKQRVIITSKQLINPADHSAMTNNEAELTAQGMIDVLAPIGTEFETAISILKTYELDRSLSLADTEKFIKAAGRKGYIVLAKERDSFHNPDSPDVVIDLDIIPALQHTALGFCASLEMEYVGSGSLDDARSTVQAISTTLGYKQKDILTKALPGLAIDYLAVF